MNLCLLTRFLSATEESNFINRMTEEARALGHRFTLLNPAHVRADLNNHAMPLTYNEEEFPPFDMIHFAVRWDDEHSWRIIDILNLWQQKVFPSARLPMGDRVTLSRLFAREGVRIPKSWTVERFGELELIATDLVYPVLIKARLAGEGRKVEVVREEAELRHKAVEVLEKAGSFLLQQMVSRMDQDVVAFVVGDEVVAAVERKWDQNHLVVEPVDLLDVEYHLARAATRIYDAPYGAVNFVRTEAGPVFMELSRIPNLAQAEEVTGVNIAGRMVEHCVNVAQKEQNLLEVS